MDDNNACERLQLAAKPCRHFPENPVTVKTCLFCWGFRSRTFTIYIIHIWTSWSCFLLQHSCTFTCWWHTTVSTL